MGEDLVVLDQGIPNLCVSNSCASWPVRVMVHAILTPLPLPLFFLQATA